MSMIRSVLVIASILFVSACGGESHEEESPAAAPAAPEPVAPTVERADDGALVVMGVRFPDGSEAFHREGNTVWVATRMPVTELLSALSPQLRGDRVGVDLAVPGDPEGLATPVPAPDWTVSLARLYPRGQAPALPQGVSAVGYQPDPTTGAPTRAE